MVFVIRLFEFGFYRGYLFCWIILGMLVIGYFICKMGINFFIYLIIGRINLLVFKCGINVVVFFCFYSLFKIVINRIKFILVLFVFFFKDVLVLLILIYGVFISIFIFFIILWYSV